MEIPSGSVVGGIGRAVVVVVPIVGGAVVVVVPIAGGAVVVVSIVGGAVVGPIAGGSVSELCGFFNVPTPMLTPIPIPIKNNTKNK